MCPIFSFRRKNGHKQALTDRIKELEAELKQAPYEAREKLIGRYGVRVGWKDLDMMAAQARIRTVDSSLNIGREDTRWIIYAGRMLEPAEINAVESQLGFRLQRD